MRLKTVLGVCLVIISAIFQSCDLVNPAAKVPSYISISGFDLKTNPKTEGSNSHRITDAWVYVDKNLVGVFELPATVPILKAGVHSVQIFPGIKVNGIAANRKTYDFYSSIDTTVTLTPNSIINFHPTVNYLSRAKFTWIENFDSQGITLYKTASSDTALELTNSVGKTFDGSICGAMYMDASRPFGEAVTSYAFNLPKKGKQVYLEFNYRSNTGFTVGVLSTDFSGTISREDVVIVQKTENNEWKKIYIDLTSTISNNQLAVTNSLYFYSGKDANLEVSDFYLDNLKLINE